jgi:hypothetical protein
MEVRLRIRALLDVRHRRGSLLLFQEEGLAVKRESREEHNPVQASSDEGSEKADQLAPLEERGGKFASESSNKEGVISVDTGDLKLPNGFTAREEGESRVFGLEPVTIIILVLALAFIAFITYLISIEPSKAKDEPTPAAQTESIKSSPQLVASSTSGFLLFEVTGRGSFPVL